MPKKFYSHPSWYRSNAVLFHWRFFKQWFYHWSSIPVTSWFLVTIYRNWPYKGFINLRYSSWCARNKTQKIVQLIGTLVFEHWKWMKTAIPIRWLWNFPFFVLCNVCSLFGDIFYCYVIEYIRTYLLMEDWPFAQISLLCFLISSQK